MSYVLNSYLLTYLHTKWHLDASSRLAAIDMAYLNPCSHLASTDMGRKLWGSAPFLGKGRWVPI